MKKFLLISAIIAINLAMTPSGGKGCDCSQPGIADSTIVCILDLRDDMFSKRGLNAGLNYEMAKRFAAAHHCTISIAMPEDSTDYLDSLRGGRIDMIIFDRADSIDTEGLVKSIELENNTRWIVNGDNEDLSFLINAWLSRMYRTSDEYSSLSKRYLRLFDPFRARENGRTLSSISPYDALIREGAQELGWDWRLLASVIYQESRFSINNISPAGAEGLMQIRPFTAEHYGIRDLLDPEKNIEAGVKYLISLQRLYIDTEITKENRIKFTLAAYNAGQGRIADCRNLAEMLGFDKNRWESILETIPYMRDGSFTDGEIVKLGAFQGYETVAYVDLINDIYNACCAVCPAS